MDIMIGLIAGGILGFGYWRIVGCRSGMCAITRDKYGSIITGALVGLMLMSSGCSNAQQEAKSDSVTQTSTTQTATIQEDYRINNATFIEKAKDTGTVILDVRTPQEFAAGHIANAVNINVNDPSFNQKIGELDANKTYLIYCKSGVRSQSAYEVMQQSGFTHLYVLTTGITGWNGEVVR